MSHSDSAATDPLLGQLLAGRYLPKRVVQQTGEFVLYEGVDEKTSRTIRLQRPLMPALPAEEVVKKVKACGPAMIKVAAVAGVVGPIEAGVRTGVPFLVLPTLSGMTISDRLVVASPTKQAVIPARAVRTWANAAAAVLDAVHSVGAVHGRLGPDAIVVAADGSVGIDGFPASQLLRALGLPARAGGAMDAYRAPEVARGAAATALSDQYSLAAVLGEALGRRPAAVEKAMSPEPDRRFADCAAFAAALGSELEAPATPVARADRTSSAPLELEQPDAADTVAASATPAHAATQGFELELEEVESASHLRRTRTKASADAEDLSDITFTKTGQSLHQSKSLYDKATNLGGARSSWRRITTDFNGLAKRKRLIASIVIGVAASLAALWLLQAAWRMVGYFARSANVVARSAVEAVRPDLGSISATGQQFTNRMQSLWNEHVDDDADEEADPKAAAVVEPSSTDEKPAEEQPPAEQQADASAWPSRVQDRLDEELVREPTDLIDELVSSKGVFVADKGLGVFDVANPRSPGQSQWIGGFGMLRKKATSKPLLHGTLIHTEEDGTTFVMRYVQGAMRDFWCTGNSATGKFVVYSAMKTVNNQPVADGAAFVLHPDDAACLALVSTDGERTGGQWCERKRKAVEATPSPDGKAPSFWESLFKKKEIKTYYEQPSRVMSIDSLKAADERVAQYMSPLDEALGRIADIEKQAKLQLGKFVRTKKLK